MRGRALGLSLATEGDPMQVASGPRRRAFAVIITVLLAPGLGRADRGALSLDLGTGVTALALRPPYAESGATRWAIGLSVSGGVRYGLSNTLELTLGGFYELPAHVSHSVASIATVDSGTFTGMLEYELSRFGVLAGVRYVTGLVVRFAFGAELGWSHQNVSGLQLRDTARPGAPDYGLGLPDLAADSLVLQPLVGLEWAFADHWSASLLLRVSALLGPEPAFGLSGSLVISYGWFL
jgi:hypothetical protein